MAYLVSSATLCKSSLRMMLRRWTSTVDGARCRLSAISGDVRPFGDHLQHLPFPSTQPERAGRAQRPAAHGIADLGGDVRAQVDAVHLHRSDGPHQLVSGLGLGHVAGRAGVQHVEDKVLVGKRRQGNDAGAGMVYLQLACRLDAVETRHADVHAHDIGVERTRNAYEFLPVTGFGDDLKIAGLFKHRAQGFPKHLMIVGKDNPDAGCGTRGTRVTLR